MKIATNNEGVTMTNQNIDGTEEVIRQPDQVQRLEPIDISINIQ